MLLLEPDDTQAFVDYAGTLVIAHDAGFFSCCTIRLRKILQYYNHFGRLPHVNSSMQWSKYKDRERDVTLEYFMPARPFKLLNHNLQFTTDTREDQFSDYRNINYKDLQSIILSYFCPSHQVIKKYHSLVDAYAIDPSNTIGILYRGNDKRKETSIPSYDSIMDQVAKTIEYNPGCQLLLQTDEIEFFNHFMEKYPNAKHFNEAIMVNHDQESVQNHIDRRNSVNCAVDFLSILLIISTCKTVILNSSNVSMWLCLYRNNADNIHQYLNDEWLNDTPLQK